MRDELEMRERELEATQNAMAKIDNQKIALKEELKQVKIECVCFSFFFLFVLFPSNEVFSLQETPPPKGHAFFFVSSRQ